MMKNYEFRKYNSIIEEHGYDKLSCRQSEGLLVGGSDRRKVVTKEVGNRRLTSVPRVEFEPMILVFQNGKEFHVLDRMTSVIGYLTNNNISVI
jgi:hypothetical protein